MTYHISVGVIWKLSLSQFGILDHVYEAISGLLYLEMQIVKLMELNVLKNLKQNDC